MLSQTKIAFSFAALSTLAVQTLSAPSSKHHTCHAESAITANFDDENYAVGGALPAASPVGVYKGLEYNAFVGVEDITNAGVKPHSPPNLIVTGLPQTLTDGTAYIGATGKTTYFDFKSFYFGCTIDSATALVTLPKECTLTARGYYQGKEHIVQEFTYVPDNNLIADQQGARTQYSKCHTGFTGVDKVEFTTDNPAVNILLLDDITYVPHTCSS